jgi:hypothetical protein
MGDTRDLYIAEYVAWRGRTAHEFSEVAVAYSSAIVGQESADHLIRRITAPRGVPATA